MGLAHGTHGWSDVAVPDMGAGAAFYGAVFGWDAETGGDGASMPYTMFSHNGKIVAGMGPLETDREDGTPSAWSSYIIVDDIEAVHRRAIELGATPLLDPIRILDSGWMSSVLDPVGASIGFWRSGAHDGAEIFNVPGAVTWNEIVTDDVETATAFYTELLGWEASSMDMEGGGTYRMFANRGRMNAGARDSAGTVPEGTPAHWMTWFCVDDCDAVATRVTDGGGSIVREPSDSPMGRTTVVTDPFGAVFSVIEGSDADGQPPR